MLNQEARTLEHTPTTGMEVHEGDIFVSSWGYSMTLVDFYQVTKVSKTGKSVSVRRLASKVVSGNIDSPQGEYVIPIKDRFEGEELRNKRLKADYGANPRPMFKVNDCASARLADGINPNGYYMNTWD